MLPLALSRCSSPTADDGRPRPPVMQASLGVTGLPIDPAAVAEPRATVPRADEKRAEAAPAGSSNAKGEAPASPKVRRIEDLPSEGPVAVRPLRPEELPAAGPGGRSRRGKGGSASDPVAANGKGGGAGRALRVEDLPSVSAAVRPLRSDELNPELVRRADELLWNHPAPVGTDIPLEVNGKSYVARFAIHYHEFGSAKKPWGYHKGVTLYSTAD